MKYHTLTGILATLFLLSMACLTAQAAEAPLQALIVTGQNNHNWQLSHPILKTILEDAGLFTVDVALSPPEGRDMSEFTPVFGDYDVVVLDYNGDDWPEATRDAFLAYVSGGGGVVVYHAANNAFPNWPEFNEVIGLGGWGGRNESHGPYIRWEDGAIIRDNSPGPGGAHGRQHQFVVTHRDTEHPITRGLPETWLHEKDELYHHLRGPAKNMTLLGTAWSDPNTGGTDNHEPVLFTIAYGEGRVFQTALGHAGELPPPALQSVGFIVTLQRGAEWAATGEVTQPVPADFPTEDTVRLRPRFKQDSLTRLMADLAAYTYNDSLEPLVMLQQIMRQRMSERASLTDLESGYVAILKSDTATQDAKLFACKQLSIFGGPTSIPVLAEMLHDKDTAFMARYALERMEGPVPLRTLRAALPRLGVEHRAGVIGALGARRDRPAVPIISAYVHDEDARVARAAITALAAIGTQPAAEMLLAVAEMKRGALQALARDAYIQCGYALLEAGTQQEAETVFNTAYDGFAEDSILRAAALRGRFAAAGLRAGEIMISILKEGDPEMQLVAASAVRELGVPGMLTRMGGLITELPAPARVVLITALQEAGAPEITPQLIQAARDEIDEVRFTALRALAVIGDDSATGFLLEHAKASSGREQALARHSLARLSGAGPVLLDVLRDGDKEIRAEVLHAVVARRFTEATPVLLDLFSGADGGEAVLLLQTLAEVAAPEHLDRLLPLLLQAEEEDAAPVLGMVASVIERGDDQEEAWKPLAEALKTEEAPVARRNLYAALGKIGNADTLPLLAEGFDESDASVRLAAVEALAGWPDDAALNLLLEAASRFKGEKEGSAAVAGYIRGVGLDEDREPWEAAELLHALLPLAATPEDREACIAALGRTGSDAALPTLYEALDSDVGDVAAAAVRGLGAWPDAAPMSRLEALAKDGPENLRLEALRGYFRLIGINRELSGDEVVARYREALDMAPNPAEQKRIMSGLSTAENLGALLVAEDYLDDPDLRSEAAVAAVRIAGHVVASHPAEVRRILKRVEANTTSNFIKGEIANVYKQADRFEDYITAWEVAGPYTLEDGSLEDLFDTAFAPEPEAEHDDVEWSVVAVGTNEALPFLVELDKALGGDRRVAYLRSQVWSDISRDAIIEIGSDDGNKIWLNGELVHKNNTVRPAQPGQDTAEVTLKEGWNTLLVKVTQDGGHWSFCARLRQPDGEPIEDVHASIRVD